MNQSCVFDASKYFFDLGGRRCITLKIFQQIIFNTKNELLSETLLHMLRERVNYCTQGRNQEKNPYQRLNAARFGIHHVSSKQNRIPRRAIASPQKMLCKVSKPRRCPLTFDPHSKFGHQLKLEIHKLDIRYGSFSKKGSKWGFHRGRHILE